jgi:hypothetical protein
VGQINRTGRETVDSEFERPAANEVEVDAATLVAIDRAIEAAKAGRSVPLDELRKTIPEWISQFSRLP